MTGISGASASLHYGWEYYWNAVGVAGDGSNRAMTGTYNSAAATRDKVFGSGAKITNLERNNNIETIWGLGSRVPQVQLEKQFAGTFSVEHVLSNHWNFRYILGNAYKVGTIGTPTTMTVGLSAGSTSLTLTTGSAFTEGQIIKLGTTRPEYAQIKTKSTNDFTLYSPTLYDHTGDTAATPYDFTDAVSPYTYAFNPFDTAPSITIQNNYNIGTPAQVLFTGAVNTSNTISFNVGDPVSFTSDFAYANETLSNTAYVTQTADPFDVFSFQNGNLYNTTPTGDITSATAMAAVQSAEVTFATNADVIYGLGSRTGQTAIGKNFEFNIRATMFFQTTEDLLELLYGGVAPSTTPGTVAYRIFRLKSTNGLAGASERTIQFDFGGVKIDTESLPQDISAPVFEEVSMKANNILVTAINATSAIP